MPDLTKAGAVMKREELFPLYLALAETTGWMLDAARAGDWDLLCTLEPARATHAEALRAADVSVASHGSDAEKRAVVIKKIMSDVSEIMNIAQPHMKQLADFLHSADVERKLSRTYCSN